MRYPFGILQRWKNVLCKLISLYPPFTGFPYVYTKKTTNNYEHFQIWNSAFTSITIYKNNEIIWQNNNVYQIGFSLNNINYGDVIKIVGDNNLLEKLIIDFTTIYEQ